MINAECCRCLAGDFSPCVPYIRLTGSIFFALTFHHAGVDEPFRAGHREYLQRADALAQAVSWLWAEQPGGWVQSIRSARRRPAQEPYLDLDQIRRLIHLIGAHNAAWQEWFESAGIEPYPARYAELAADPAGVARDVLAPRVG